MFGHFWHGVKQHILVRHDHHRHIAAKPFAHFARTIARSIHNVIARNIALGGRDHPFIAFAPRACGGAKAFNPCPQIARALGQRLGQLCGVNIAIIGIIKRAF